MKIRGKILILSLLPLTLVAIESLLSIYLKTRSDRVLSRNIMGSIGRIMGITWLITLPVVLITVYRLTSSLKRTMKIIEAAARGDLTVEFLQKDLARKDEIGNIARAAGRLQQSLREIAGGLQQTTISLLETSRDLEQMSLQTGEAADSVARAAGDIAAGSTTQADAAGNITGSMQSVTEAAEDSSRAVTRFRQIMGDIRELGDQGIRAMEELGDCRPDQPAGPQCLYRSCQSR